MKKVAPSARWAPISSEARSRIATATVSGLKPGCSARKYEICLPSVHERVRDVRVELDVLLKSDVQSTDPIRVVILEIAHECVFGGKNGVVDRHVGRPVVDQTDVCVRLVA